MSSKPSWFHRHQIWLVSALVVLAIALGVGFIGTVYYFVSGMMRSSEPYQTALACAKADQKIVQRLGVPIEEGWFSSGSISYSGSSGHADLAIPVSGPLDSATIYVEASRSAGKWTVSTLVCEFKSSGDRISISPDLANSRAEKDEPVTGTGN